jgi:tRNA A37 threonylcarbamoyladenosine modification protein TsaB
MASALAKPIVGVSTAEAVAHPFLNDDIPVAALIESGRTQLFVQLFERTGTGASPITEPMAVTPTEIGRAVRMRALLVGSPVDAYRETFRAVLAENALFPERGLCYHHAGVVATIAERNFRRTGKAETPSPIYVRPADDVYPPPAGEASPVGGPP